MIHKSRRVQWTDTGQRVCLQHKSWRKLKGGQRGHFQRQIMTTYLLKRHQRRKESIILPRQESRGLGIIIIFCLLHTGRKTPSKSQGLTLLFMWDLGKKGCVCGGEERVGGPQGVGVSARVGNEGNRYSQTWIEMKLKHSTLNLLHITKHDNENFLAHISS